jgi:hypothetical protein
MYLVAGLVKDAHQARGLIRALQDDGFERQEVDMAGPLSALTDLGIPEGEAHVLAEGARRGGSIVVVKADDEFEAEQAALLMGRHGAVDIEACAQGWRSQGWKGRLAEPHSTIVVERYALVFGDYPGGSGRIHRDPRTVPSPSVRTPGTAPDRPYPGPERRRRDKPYVGINRRAA